jgi:hypothetical protein
VARPKLDTPNYALTRRGARYYVKWWENGAWHRLSTGTEDERAAKVFLKQFIAGRDSPPPPAQPTIGQILDGYLANRKGEVSSYQTLEAACNAIRRHLGDLEPQHLTEQRGKFSSAGTRGMRSGRKARSAESPPRTALS